MNFIGGYIFLFLFVAAPVIAVLQLRPATIGPAGRYFRTLALVFMAGFAIGFPCLALYSIHRQHLVQQEMAQWQAQAQARMIAAMQAHQHH